MQFSEKWLREWVDPKVSTQELVAQLTAAGLEVDSVQPVAADLQGIVVGEVLSVAPHPNADRLTVCSVDIGQASPLTVVCGARNVRESLRVPVAPLGVQLADGTAMKRVKIRGQESTGMLCSTQELGFTESAEGLMELATDAPVGTTFADYLSLNDVSIEIDLTPNRGDCLSVAGIVREVGVLNRCPVLPPAMPPVAATISDEFPVILVSPTDCPHYVGRVIRNIDPRAETPIWMQERLRRSGLRSISPMVDVTNYVMLELGQPMHAFDLDTLNSEIRVRRAKPGETLTLLDGAKITLHDTLVIADANRPVALAGIMGGKDMAITETTKHIFLESAFFAPKALAGQARRYALHTDSSHRFERGVDWRLQRIATERATALLLDIVGGKPGPIIEETAEPELPQSNPIRLRASRLQRVLGIPFPIDTVSDVLARLGMDTAVDGDTWNVTPPSFRFDIAIEADLIEEVARITGYDQIPAKRPVLPLASHKASDSTISLGSMRQVLVERGYQEAITYSFVDPAIASLVDETVPTLALRNPISAEMAIMRTSLLPGLLQAVIHNIRRQQTRIRLFESGLIFNQNNSGQSIGESIQEQVLGAIATGPVFPEQWGTAARNVDFFDMKSDVQAILSLTGWSQACRFVRFSHPALHPGQSARIERVHHEAGQDISRGIGWIGNLHPRITRKLKLNGDILVFQVQLAELEAGKLPSYTSLSKFPAVRRDIAVIVDKKLSAHSVQECIHQAGTNLLKDITLFDEYRGDGIDQGRKSLAFGLLFQDTSRTLQDSEIDGLVTGIMSALQDRLGGVPRV